MGCTSIPNAQDCALRARYGAAATLRAAAELDADVMVDRYAAVYREVVGG